MERRNLSPTRVPVAGEQTCNLSEWRSLSPGIIIYAYAESKLERRRVDSPGQHVLGWPYTAKSIDFQIIVECRQVDSIHCS